MLSEKNGLFIDIQWRLIVINIHLHSSFTIAIIITIQYAIVESVSTNTTVLLKIGQTNTATNNLFLYFFLIGEYGHFEEVLISFCSVRIGTWNATPLKKKSRIENQCRFINEWLLFMKLG